MEITHDYATKKGAIPLPATLSILLGNRIGEKVEGTQVRLYSDYPFHWRKSEGGPRDDFERDALQYLRQFPDKRFYRFEEFRGRPSLRYAIADVLRPGCVGCHNTHPASPKTDWKEGEVRGVLEIIRPLDGVVVQTHAGLKETFGILGVMGILALSGLAIVVGRLHRISSELEQRMVILGKAKEKLEKEIAEREQAEEALRTKTEQLSSVTDAMTNFLEKGNWREASATLLRAALAQTDSEYGFIGVVVEGPVLRILAHEGIVWNKNINREFYENAVRTYSEVGYLEFTNFENLFGRVITTGKAVISNDPGSDPRSGGLPPGHPPLRSFLGVPILRGTEVVGMTGVANRPGGYTGTELARIEILSRAAGVLYDSYRRQKREAVLEEERKRAEEALAEQAIRDPLTNLYNRRYFNRRIEEEIARANRNRQPLAILLCDLDHFKTINDTRGHQVGDEVLKEAAKCIQESTRGTDLVFRWGGDEIVVVLADATRDGVLIVAERIRRGVQTISQQTHLKLDLSIGMALYPEHGGSVDELIRIADQALYIAKKGGDKVKIGIEEYYLDERSIKVVFQPVVSTRPVGNSRTHHAIGYEALSRDPEEKLSILDLFKKYRAIGKLNELKCICFTTQLKAAQKIGLKRVFINVDFNVLNQVELIPKPEGMEVILEISELEAIHDVETVVSG
jgi:diguanylate cyclase (GGDEF)-like protein